MKQRLVPILSLCGFVLLLLLAALVTDSDQTDTGGFGAASSTIRSAQAETTGGSAEAKEADSSGALPSPGPDTTAPENAVAYNGTDSNGFRIIALSSLPLEGMETFRLVESDGPFPYDRDGTTFQNWERILPPKSRGHYREYTIPTPGSSDRGARRFVVGEDGDVYYTADHYDSFVRVDVDR